MERTERFGLILSPAEKRTLARLAEVEGGLSQAAILRHLLRRAARERGLWPPDEWQVSERGQTTQGVPSP